MFQIFSLATTQMSFLRYFRACQRLEGEEEWMEFQWKMSVQKLSFEILKPRQLQDLGLGVGVEDRHVCYCCAVVVVMEDHYGGLLYADRYFAEQVWGASFNLNFWSAKNSHFTKKE